jgi:tRNA A-37 threonylcarbamoyl transferase component Bud32
MQATIRIKGYDGIEQLALGKRAVVFKARSRKLKRPVVVKVLLPHLLGDRRFMARFERDVRLAGRIRDESIVNVLDYGRVENSVYLVVESYDGVSLEEVLAEHHKVPLDVALSIVLSVCRGLEAAHALGLVHRDVRPSNVILTEDGGVKLANFALATDIGESGRVTHAGRVTATPAYMSPEQTHGEDVSGQSDIFSLGSVAFEVLTGKRAFGSGHFGEILDRIQNAVLPGAGSVNPLVEAPFERIIARTTQKDRAHRYAHVSEVLMDLEEAMDKYGLRTDPGRIAEFVADPAGCFEEYARWTLEKLAARAPTREVSSPANAAALVRYYRKVVYLDPADEGAKHELSRLAAKPPRESPRGEPDGEGDGAGRILSGMRYADLDPNAQYRVVLESIDSARDNEASFALKMSMKLRTPLPRIKSLVRNMPARIADQIPYKRALHLAKLVEEMGGKVRLDVCPSQGPVSSSEGGKTAPSDSSRNGRTCPACGWVEEYDAEFCSVCLKSFTRSKKVNVTALRDSAAADNPLDESPQRHIDLTAYASSIAGLPLAVKIGGAALLVVLFLLLAFLR